MVLWIGWHRDIDGSGSDLARRAVSDGNGNIYICGQEGHSSTGSWVIRSSSDGSSGSFGFVDYFNRGIFNDGTARDIVVDSNGTIYAVGSGPNPTSNNQNWIVRKSTTGESGSFVFVDDYNDSDLNEFYGAYGIVMDSEDNIYVVGRTNYKFSAVRKGKLTANSASLGAKMLSPSIGYVYEEALGSTNERFKLNNISEFPHFGGIFQMPNIILGTKDSGRAGKEEDSIVRIKHFGSVVNIMWPKIENESSIKGFGDTSVGARPGSLTTVWNAGDWVDVSKDNFDHLNLYSYLTKETKGTNDSILLRIETKPLKNIGSVVDQGIEYEKSGSFIEAVHKDMIIRKDVDYSDLSIREIGWDHKIPLVNVKEIRISAKQKVGQIAKDNTNLIVYGRFIKSTDET